MNSVPKTTTIQNFENPRDSPRTFEIVANSWKVKNRRREIYIEREMIVNANLKIPSGRANLLGEEEV